MYHVVFDMDGVILDSERELLKCWLDAAENYGLDPEYVRRIYLQCIGTNSSQTKEIYRNAFLGQLGEENLWRLWEESYALYQTRFPDGVLPIKAGVREVLEYLKARGVSVGIASSTRKQIVEQRIGSVGLSGYFVGFLGGDAVRVSKPNPEIYLLACEEFGFEPKDTFAIEDSYNGIRAAAAAGMRPIMVPDLVPPDKEMNHLAEVICRDLFEVREYLQDRCSQGTKKL